MPEKESVLEEIQGLAAAGYKEFVLTGIHISSYGMEELLSLVQAIDSMEGWNESVSALSNRASSQRTLQEDSLQ